MKKEVALAILAFFSICGVLIALWAWFDLTESRSSIIDCVATTIDVSSFYLLALIGLPLFFVLGFIPERMHAALLILAVCVFVTIPAVAYVEFVSLAEKQDVKFEPELKFFRLVSVYAQPRHQCKNT